LFIGPAHTESQTHIDSFGSNFWMALMEGKKRWVLVHPDDDYMLNPRWIPGCSDIVFDVNMKNLEDKREDLFRYSML